MFVLSGLSGLILNGRNKKSREKIIEHQSNTLQYTPRVSMYFNVFNTLSKLIVANLGYTLDVFSIEVYSILLLDGCISIIFSIVELIDLKNFKKGLYSMLRVVSHVIPLTLLVIYFPLFREHTVLVILLVIVYLFKVFVSIRNYLLHVSFELTLKTHMQEFTSYDLQRLEKIKRQLTINSHSNYDLFIYCIWLIIPGFWLANTIAVLTIFLGMFSGGKHANINSIDNPKTFLTEVNSPINSTIIAISFLLLLVFGVNFEIILLLSILYEFSQVISFRLKTMPQNLGILNVGKQPSLLLFEKVGETLLKRINSVKPISKFFKKNKINDENGYAILNNFSAIYETNSDEFRYTELRKRARNFVLILNNDGSDLIHRLEDDFRYGLNNLMVTLDCYQVINQYAKQDDYSTKIDIHEYNLAKWRINMYSRLCDEKFALLESDQMFSKIHEKISTESILININLRSSFTHDELARLNELEGSGIFELNNLFRQAHETPSIPLRFIINIMVWEASVQYLCGFLLAKPINSLEPSTFFMQEAWNKDLSFGDFVSNLDQLLKTPEDGVIFNRIRDLMNVKYQDKEGMKLFTNLLIFYGWKDKIPSEPSVQKLIAFMSFLRNKTRGHGIPSKVDFDFFLILEKLSLFLLSEIQKLNFGLYTVIDAEEWNEKWLVNLSAGGCPDLFPFIDTEDQLTASYPYYSKGEFITKRKNLDPLIESMTHTKARVVLAVEAEQQLEFYTLDDFFKSEDGVLLAYHGQRKNSRSYISYVTGDLIRPTMAVSDH
jgi:hypothetical protein